MWALHFTAGSIQLSKEVLLGKDTTSWFDIIVQGKSERIKSRFFLQQESDEASQYS